MVTESTPLRLGPFAFRHLYVGPNDDPAPFLDSVRHWASSGAIVGVDVETNGRRFYEGRDFVLTVASFAGPDVVYTLDGRHRSALGVATEALRLVAHNAPYDGLALRAWTGVTPKIAADSQIAALLHEPPVDPTSKYDLKSLTADQGWTELGEATDLLYATFDGLKSGHGWAEIPAESEILIRYNALDAAATRALYLDIVSRMAPGPAALLALESRLQHVWTGATWRGLRVDREALASEIDRLEAEVERIGGTLREFGIENPRSQKQLVKWFASEGAVFTEFTSKGNPSFSAEAIPSLTQFGQPERVRAAAQLLGDYNVYSGLLNKVVELDGYAVYDGRLHPFVNTLRARTGRFSLDSPALQNLPDGPIRQTLIADDGHVLVGADFQAIEMRIAAALSGDPRMIDAIVAETDLHGETARAIFGDGYTPEQRKIAKVVAFATLYGGGVKAISSQAGIDEEQAAEIRSSFFQTYPRLADLVHEVQSYKAVVTPTGRRIPAPEGREYALANFLIQSTARDVFAHACMRLVEDGFGPNLWLPVHDEIILHVPEGSEDEAVEALQRSMTMTFEGVPIECDPEIHGRRWGGEPEVEERRADAAA